MVAVHIASCEITTTTQDDIDNSVNISNIDLVVTIDIPCYATTTITRDNDVSGTIS